MFAPGAVVAFPRREPASAHSLLDQRAEPLLLSSAQLGQRVTDGPHRPVVQVRRLRIAFEEASPDADPAAELGITAREREVLMLLAEGKTNRQIAETLVITEKTASVHVSHILAKLDARNRSEAAAIAHRRGLTASADDDRL